KPGAGIIVLKRMRTLLRYAMDIGWRESDPTARVRAFKSIEIHTWTESEISQFELRWPIGTKQRLAFDLLLYTGQRGSDVARIARPAAGEKIRVVQQKTGAPLTITVHPEWCRRDWCWNSVTRSPAFREYRVRRRGQLADRWMF